MSDQSNQWYFAPAGDRREGPVSRESLQALRAAGQISDETLVWSPGMSGWTAYGQVFGSVHAGAPPPLPPRDAPTGAGGRPEAAASPGWAAPEATVTAAGTTNIYAGFWRRAAAYIIDYIVLFIAVAVGFAAIASSGVPPERAAALNMLVVYGLYWLYRAGMHSSGFQATVGKLALGIKVSDLAGQRIGFGRSTGRVIAEFLAGLTLGVGFVMAGFTKRRQALSDMMAGTLVVKKNVTADEIAANPIAPKVPVWAATLLILAGGLGPIGILAAIAIPAYQDYSVRAEVTDALMSASTYKAAIAESIANGAAWEDITTESLGPGAQANSKYLQSSEVYGGVILLTFGQNASSVISGKQLVLVPGVANDGSVVWTCGYAKAPYGVELALDEHTKYTDVPSKYLPSACR
jgi:uncharacterized RDD family membrane protein YckC/Tfp pilus assembly major pilin PilA